MKALWARLRSAYEGLSDSERRLVLAAGATLALAILVFGVVNPVLSASARATQRVETAERELETVRELRKRYDDVQARLSRVERDIQSGPRGEIFTTLESLARDSTVKVDSMEPRTSPASDAYKETKVQVVLKGVTLAQLVNYLHRIEAARQVLSVKSLRMRTRQDKPEMMDVTFTVSSFEPA